jgi:hypothetical protein
MAQTRTEPIKISAWIALIFAVLFLFVFHSLLGNLTSSHLANTLIVGAATLGSGAVLTFAYVTSIVILRVYRKARAQVRYQVSPQLDLLQLEDLPPEFAPAVGNTASALSPLGFRLIGCVKVITVPGTTFYLGIVYNPRARTIARCALVVQNDLSEEVLVFQTRFADGTECSTGHVSPAFLVRTIQALPKGRSSLAFFDIRDPARLARLHAAAVEKHHSGPVDTGTLDPISIQNEAFEREMATQLDAGYLRQEGDEYCTTRIGALKMALKLVWPVFALRIRSARRRAERFLAETGL